MLSRTDETELLLPLYEGLHEQPRWSTFLSRLQRRARADYAGLIFRQGHLREATELFAGRDVRAECRARGQEDWLGMAAIRDDRLRPARVYSIDELLDPDDPTTTAARRDRLARSGLSFARFMRVAVPGGIGAWTILLRDDRDFTAADGALLGTLAPHLAVALTSFAELEAARLRLDLGDAALGRLGVGWIALDADARLIAASGEADRRLRAASGIVGAIGERLVAPLPGAERALHQASTVFAQDPGAAPRAVRFSEEPPLEMVVAPWRAGTLAARSIPVLIGLLRGPIAGGSDRPALLAVLFGLTASEARLADALAGGQSIAQAAVTIGITIQSARFYSKQLYAKTGTHGQGDLIRLVLNSVASLG